MITSDKSSHFNRHGEQRRRSGDIEDGKVEGKGGQEGEGRQGWRDWRRDKKMKKMVDKKQRRSRQGRKEGMQHTPAIKDDHHSQGPSGMGSALSE